MPFLLDTNVCIALINASSRGTAEPVRARFAKAAAAGEELWVSSIAVQELWYGVAKSVQIRANTQRLEKFLAGPVRLLEFTAEDARHAGEVRAALERPGRPIGAYDVLMAGQALHHRLTLVTANTREFGRVKELVWQDWSA